MSLINNTNHYDLDLGLLLLNITSLNKGLALHRTLQAKEAAVIPLGSISNRTMNFTPAGLSSGSLKSSPSSTMQRTMLPEESTFITPPGHSPRVVSVTRERKVNRQKVNNWITNMRTKYWEGNGMMAEICFGPLSSSPDPEQSRAEGKVESESEKADSC